MRDRLPRLAPGFLDVRRARVTNRRQDHAHLRLARRRPRPEILQQQLGPVQMFVVVFGDDEHLVRLHEAGEHGRGHLVGKITNDVVVLLHEVSENRGDERDLAFVTHKIENQAVVPQRGAHHQVLQPEATVKIEPFALQQRHAALLAAQIEQ